MFDLSIINISFNKISFTTLFSLLKSTGVVSDFRISNLSNLLFKLLKPLGTFFNLSTSDFKLAESVFLAKSSVSTPVTFFKSVFVA